MSRVLFLSLFFVCASQAFAQSGADSDSTRRLIKLSVAATDARGEPVTDLRIAEVQVREDGKLRPTVFFRFAGSKRSIAPPAPGEFINRPAVPPIVILFDRWNEKMMTAASTWLSITTALQRLESVDRVYIYFLTNHGELFPVNPLPGADAGLRTAAGPSSGELIANLNQAVRKLQGFRDIDVEDPFLRVKTTFHALDTLGNQMASIAGRKNLIWVTHGIPLMVRLDPSDQWTDFTPQVRNLSAAFAQSQIAIYTVDESAAGAGADPNGVSRATLEMFAALTGGRWYSSGNSERALTDAVTDARGNYRLAYYSAIREKDHKEHKIRVEPVRKGVRLMTREGYAGDAPEPSADQVEAAAFNTERQSPFDATEIGLRVVMSRKPSSATVHFDIHVDRADVLIEHRGDRYQGVLGVMLASYNEGLLKEPSAPIHVDINLTQEQFDQAAKNGIVIPQDLPVSDQIQKVRVMVFDRGLYELGSVTIPMK